MYKDIVESGLTFACFVVINKR